MKNKTTINNFGERLVYFRKAKGLTQKALGKKVGVSNRVIAYYEKETDYPPAHLIVPLAKALEVSTDELLGMVELKKDFDTRNATLLRNLKIVEQLPQTDQRAILHYIKMMAKNRGVEQNITQ